MSIRRPRPVGLPRQTACSWCCLPNISTNRLNLFKLRTNYSDEAMISGVIYLGVSHSLLSARFSCVYVIFVGLHTADFVDISVFTFLAWMHFTIHTFFPVDKHQ